MTLIFILHSLTLLIISNRISAVIIMIIPLMDVNGDLLYCLVEKFYSTKLFYLTILFYIIPNLTFVYRLYELRARPYFISSFFLIFLKDFIWIAIEDSHPTFHKKTILWNYPQHDNLFKVVFYIVKWIFVIVLQIISIFSSSFSVFMICNGIYRYLYYMFILKTNIEDIPTDIDMCKKMFHICVIKLFSQKKSKNNNKDAILDDEKR